MWVAGGVVTDDFRISMGLTGLWFVAALAAAYAARGPYRLPLLAGVGVAAIAIGGYLAATTLRDRVVDERVIAGPVVARGDIVGVEHASRGDAAIVRRGDGRHVLTLTSFSTAAGPDLRVRVDGRDLGGLKGNIGDQQYVLPRGLRPRVVMIWCRAFSAEFARAQLKHS